MKILVTGAAGFIGYHTCENLLARGHEVFGVDNINDYYDKNLKFARLGKLRTKGGFKFDELDISDRRGIELYFNKIKPNRVIHLAAQAGVRYSIENPHAYIDANLVGFTNILEGCRRNNVDHLVYASSSSVYGANKKLPFSITQPVDHPVSLYAATKKANELMAHTYSHLYRIPTTGLRFFTVYGPWGRPDMAIFMFTKSILENKPINVYNFGRMQRDFTYIDDIVEGVVKTCYQIPVETKVASDCGLEPGTSDAPYRIYNIGNSSPVGLMHVIECIEKSIGKSVEKILLPMQMGDVPATFADVDALTTAVGFRPATPIEVGVERFVKWYKEFYNI
jgi:UDP-glucuronate 4-epimerase